MKWLMDFIGNYIGVFFLSLGLVLSIMWGGSLCYWIFFAIYMIAK